MPLKDLLDPDYSAVGSKYRLSGYEFVPIVASVLRTHCEVDLLLLRREEPGALITKPADEYGGDLDNRLKVFLDGLRVPQNTDEIPKDAQEPAAGESPFYCLLEDDSLITRFSVESDTLLGDPPPSGNAKDVRIIARITTKVVAPNFSNFSLMDFR